MTPPTTSDMDAMDADCRIFGERASLARQWERLESTKRADRISRDHEASGTPRVITSSNVRRTNAADLGRD